MFDVVFKWKRNERERVKKGEQVKIKNKKKENT